MGPCQTGWEDYGLGSGSYEMKSTKARTLADR